MNLGYCKILGCDSKKRDAMRHFFQIPVANKEKWVNIIKSYQPEVLLDFNSKILICDKHFNDEDILMLGINQRRLKCGALPMLPVSQDKINLVTQNQNDEHLEEAEENSHTSSWMTQIQNDEFFEEAGENSHISNLNDDKTTISIHTFNKLLQESVELIKAKKTIRKLENIIRTKENEKRALVEQMKQMKMGNNEILNCLKDGKPEMQYSPTIRDFSLSLRFHSTAAYKFIRSKFDDNLPAIRTIQKWCESVDGSPGISLDAFEAIRTIAVLYASEHEGKEMPVCLISDEMALRKDASWQKNVKDFMGFAEYENISKNNTDENDNKLPLAYNALVFMVVGENFKIPVAYHLLAGLDAITRAALTHEAIVRINETGVRIITLTSDGLVANVAVATKLGADFKNNKPYFTSPTNENHKIYIIWDDTT